MARNAVLGKGCEGHRQASDATFSIPPRNQGFQLGATQKRGTILRGLGGAETGNNNSACLQP